MENTAVSRRNNTACVAVLTAALVTWCVVVGEPAWLPSGFSVALTSAARSLTGGLLLVAGATRFVSWRLTGDGRNARAAIALLVLGVALPAADLADAQLRAARIVTLEASPARLAFLLSGFGAVVLGTLARRRKASLLVAGTIAGFLGATLVVSGLVVLTAGSAIPGYELNPTWVCLEIAAAGVWTVVAVGFLRLRAEGPVTVPWIVLAALLMAGSEALKGWRVADPGVLRGAASGFQLAAASLVVLASVSDTVATFGVERRRSREITAALRETQRHLTSVEQRERVRLHDARSAVLGVMGASELLAEPTVPAADRTRLGLLVNAELDRLQGVLACESDEPARTFTVADALDPVLSAHRLGGMALRTDLGEASARGCPRTLATVLDNLLTNARVHAPNANVEVCASGVGTVVVISVEDDGPGIPPAERAAVLRAGSRGSTARGAGSGLGLYSAACAMADQGGTLRISERAGGGTRIALTFPRIVATAGALGATATAS